MTCVAILWHMHQPFYQDMATGEHVLPWVRLHALKDYWGMVALLKEFPDVRVTFNLVPSLLVQIEAFATERALDPHLQVGLKAADSLTDAERAFCVEHFFRAHWPRMVEPYPRYAELLAIRERSGGAAGHAAFTVEDLRDLQVWHKLVWLDPYYLERDDRARALVAKGRGFTEDDKLRLRSLELELLRSVVPEYRAAAARGQVELSTSPFYHPILPLLCDSDVHLAAHPHSRMPRQAFRHPEDAAEQLSRAVEFHHRLFGRRPAGVWPSEGSVSDLTVSLIGQAGFSWMATDEGILSRTLRRDLTRSADGHADQPDVLYRPYRLGQGQTVACGFRDHALSDLIGFSYASWSAEAAAEDFVNRLVEAGQRYAARTGGGEATIFVILDGENAWEHYDGQGRPFLRALYGRLSAHQELAAVTMTDACEAATERLPTVFPGSWINSDFYIWIGHEDDHRAWSQLGDARRALAAAQATAAKEAVAAAKEELLIAEGSDWFWWYGDDHSSENDLEFDRLFRAHVSNVYRALNQAVPEELLVSNISTQPPSETIQAPTGILSPTLDGEVSSYFEWIGAGGLEGGQRGGAMTRGTAAAAERIEVTFGFATDALLIRVDGARPIRELLEEGLEVRVSFMKPEGRQILVAAKGGVTGATLRRRTGSGHWTDGGDRGMRAAAGRILELSASFEALEIGPGTQLAFTVSLHKGATVVDQQPHHRAIDVQVPGADGMLATEWSV